MGVLGFYRPHIEPSKKSKSNRILKVFCSSPPAGSKKNNLTRLGDTTAKWKVSTSLVTLSVRYLKNIRSATWPRSLSPMSKLSNSGPGCWLHISLMCAIVWSWQWWLKSTSELFFLKINPKFRVWWLSVFFSDFSDAVSASSPMIPCFFGDGLLCRQSTWSTVARDRCGIVVDTFVAVHASQGLIQMIARLQVLNQKLLTKPRQRFLS